MRTKIVQKALVGAALLLAFSDYAGYKIHYSVSVNTSSRTAFGSTGDARASANSTESIGCYIAQNSATSEVLFGGCNATDVNGNSVYCYFPSAVVNSYAKVLAANGSNAYYFFQWDASSACTYVYSTTASDFTPLTP